MYLLRFFSPSQWHLVLSCCYNSNSTYQLSTGHSLQPKAASYFGGPTSPKLSHSCLKKYKGVHFFVRTAQHDPAEDCKMS